MMRCPKCNGIIKTKKRCKICGKKFIPTNNGQILCSNLVCKKTRQLRKQKLWVKKNRKYFTGAGLFYGCFIKCVICDDVVQQVRILQVTCDKIICKKKRDIKSFRHLKQKRMLVT